MKALSFVVALIFSVALHFAYIVTPAEAGYWVPTQSCALPNGGEGSGPGKAAASEQCEFPASRPITGCSYFNGQYTCTSEGNDATCNLNPVDYFECWGFSQHYCYAGEAMDQSGQCVPKTPQPNCSPSQADPVQIDSGAVFESEVDWSSGGKDPLEFRRHYLSSESILIGPGYSRLGPKWRSNFDGGATYVFANAATTPSTAQNGDRIHFVLPDNLEYSFTMWAGVWQFTVPRFHPTTGNYIYWDTFRSDLDVSLTTTASSVDLRTPNGVHYVFDLQGLMTQIVNPDGYTQSLNYSGTYNTGVTDSFGRKLTFVLDNAYARAGFLTSVTANDGSKISYTYVNRSIDPLLANATLLPAWALGTVILPDATPLTDTDNPKRTYQYLNDLHYPYALTSVTDERGIVFSTWTYDANGRALTNEHSSGADHYNFAYDDVNNKVTVTNPLGRNTTYSIQTVQGMINRIVAVDGIVTSNCAASNTAYTYDTNGFRNQATDAEGRITQWTRNARGLATTTVEGVGSPVARTTTTTWDPARPFPTQLVVPGLTTNLSYNSAGNLTQVSQVDTTSTTVPYSTNGQTRTTTFNYTAFTAPPPPAIAATGTMLSNVVLTLINPGAESGSTVGWVSQNATSPLALRTGAPCVTANCFGSNGSTVYPPLPMVAYQDVLIPAANTTEVDAGRRAIKINWNQYNGLNRDEGTVRVLFLDGTSTQIAANEAPPVLDIVWTARSKTTPVPVGTRTVRIEMVVPGFYYWGAGNTSFDDVAVTLIGDGSASATPYLTVVNPDASNATLGWTVPSGTVNVLTTGKCSTYACFVGTTRGLDQFTQDIAISTDRYAEVDANARSVELQWMSQSENALRVSYAQLDFLDASNAVITGASVISPSVAFVPDYYSWPNVWAARSQNGDVPSLARKIRVTFTFDHPAGVAPLNSNAYITGISLQLKGRLGPPGSVNVLTSVDGPLAGTGDTVSYAYDVNGNVSQITSQVGLITKILGYDGAGRPTSIQGPDGVNTALTYDPRGRVSTLTLNPGASQSQTAFTYDAAGDVIQVTRPDGSFLQYTYDNVRRVSTVINNTGESQTYTYNLNSQPLTAVTKSSGNVITKQMSMTYDELGRLLKSIGAATQTSTFSYDRTDNLTQVKDPRSNLYGLAYDGLNRLVQSKNEENATVTVARNTLDAVTSYQDPRTITTSYVRDGFGEVIQEVSPDAGTSTTVYDARGLVTQATDGRGVVLNKTYDNAGRLLTDVTPAATAENVTYAYDSIVGSAFGKGRLTSITDQSGSTTFTYNALGQIVTDKRVIATKAYTTSYLYNAAGHISQITYPSGRIVIYARNSLGQVTGVTSKQTSASAAVNVATGITYAPLSNLVTSLTHGNGLITTATYDQDYRLSGLNVKNGVNSL